MVDISIVDGVINRLISGGPHIVRVVAMMVHDHNVVRQKNEGAIFDGDHDEHLFGGLMIGDPHTHV